MNNNPILKAVIVDDELHARESLRGAILNQFPQIEIVGEAGDVEAAIAVIQQQAPDLLFLDVQLGPQTCFEILGRLARRDFDLIFTTAYDHYAIPAIKLAAIDYLLKPIQPRELATAIQRCLENASNRSRDKRLETFFQNEGGTHRRIMLSGTRGFEMADISDILYVVADGNYTDFHFKSSKPIKVAKTMGEYEPLLAPYGILRIHISHMVNVQFIKSYSGGRGGTVIMTDGRELQLSQRRKQEFLQKIDLMQKRNG